MHAAIVHFAPILGAEKSKVPFYIAGGALVAWALLVSLGMGLRMGSFPGTIAAERIVMAVTALLVVGATSMAVVTSGGSTKEAQASSARQSATPAGGSSTPGAPARARTKLAQAADPSGQLNFVKSTLTASAGKVSVQFTNHSPLPHNFTIAQGNKTLGATPTFNGGSKTLALKLKPGTYTFFCSVPGHREAGMEGRLVVS